MIPTMASTSPAAMITSSERSTTIVRVQSSALTVTPNTTAPVPAVTAGPDLPRARSATATVTTVIIPTATASTADNSSSTRGALRRAALRKAVIANRVAPMTMKAIAREARTTSDRGPSSVVAEPARACHRSSRPVLAAMIATQMTMPMPMMASTRPW